MAKRNTKVRSITVLGRRWFDRRHGNTYFSAQILVNGAAVHRIDYEYGYGDQYLQEAFEWLDKRGHTSRERYSYGGSELPRMYCERKGIDFHAEASDVSRKRDL